MNKKKFKTALLRGAFFVGLLLMALVAFLPEPVLAQVGGWLRCTSSANDVCYPNGNVGIGTMSPGARLEIDPQHGNIFKPALIVHSGGDHLKLVDVGDGDSMTIGRNDNRTDFVDSFYGAIMTLTENGNVGIGTLSPSAKLDVQGHMELNNHNLNRVNAIYISDPGEEEGLQWLESAAKITVSPLKGGNTDGYLRLINDGGIVFEPGAQNTEAMTLNADGNVGIGTTSPHSKLQVSDGYIQLAINNGMPPASDCDSADEIGRMKVDSSRPYLYVCMAQGWTRK